MIQIRSITITSQKMLSEMRKNITIFNERMVCVTKTQNETLDVSVNTKIQFSLT